MAATRPDVWEVVFLLWINVDVFLLVLQPVPFYCDTDRRCLTLYSALPMCRSWRLALPELCCCPPVSLCMCCPTTHQLPLEGWLKSFIYFQFSLNLCGITLNLFKLLIHNTHTLVYTMLWILPVFSENHWQCPPSMFAFVFMTSRVATALCRIFTRYKCVALFSLKFFFKDK